MLSNGNGVRQSSKEEEELGSKLDAILWQQCLHWKSGSLFKLNAKPEHLRETLVGLVRKDLKLPTKHH